MLRSSRSPCCEPGETSWHGPARRGKARHGSARRGSAGLGGARQGMGANGAFGIEEPKPPWLGQAGHGQARPGMARRGVARQGEAGRGTAWLGKAWAPMAQTCFFSSEVTMFEQNPEIG